MRILYGVQGTGNGHITRARAMAEELQKRGVEVDYLFSGRQADTFFDMEVFGDYRVQEGLTFATAQGRINTFKTLLSSKPVQLLRDIFGLETDRYDLIVTDFEPITAWAAKLRRKPAIGLGHQYAFHQPIPQHHGGITQQLILKYFAPARYRLGLHWNHFNHAILPPIAPVEHAITDTRKRSYLVYLPFESPAEIEALLGPFDNYTFNIYHPEITPACRGNLNWHRPGRYTFQNDLHRCEGVICNAGFELASEVLQLGKKLLVKPLKGQSEQYSNALALDLLGYGHVMYQLDRNRLENWLQFACATRIHYPNVAAAICEWLISGRAEEITALAKRLWEETQLPDMTAATRTELQLTAATHSITGVQLSSALSQ